jgi:hypothetical protein
MDKTPTLDISGRCFHPERTQGIYFIASFSHAKCYAPSCGMIIDYEYALSDPKELRGKTKILCLDWIPAFAGMTATYDTGCFAHMLRMTASPSPPEGTPPQLPTLGTVRLAAACFSRTCSAKGRAESNPGRFPSN